LFVAVVVVVVVVVVVIDLLIGRYGKKG